MANSGDSMNMNMRVIAATAVAAAAIAAALRARRRATRRVAVASTAAQKTEAAARALDATAVGEKVPSLVSDQPIGLDETLRGAKNRMSQLLDTDAVTGADLAVCN